MVHCSLKQTNYLTLIVSLELHVCFVSFVLASRHRSGYKGEKDEFAHASLQTTSYTLLMSLPNITSNTKVPTYATYRDEMENNDKIFSTIATTKNINFQIFNANISKECGLCK